MASTTQHSPPLSVALRGEWPLLLSFITTALFAFNGKAWLSDLSNPLWFGFMSLWLFGVIMASAFAIVRHAESLAVILGEPLGTLVLTLAVIGIEVMMISAVMLTGKGDPAIARDTMFAVVMLILNGLVGLALLLGGWKHREQTYNVYGANAFLALIVPLATLGMVLPNFTRSSPGPTFSPFQAVFLSLMSLGIYGVFLATQTGRHSSYFVAPDSDEAGHAHGHGDMAVQSTPYHAILLIAFMAPLVVLAKQLAVPIEYGVKAFGAPPALSGLIVAVIILSPEAMSAIRAALDNQLQRSVNILLGSVLATIGLTIPAVLSIGLFTKKTVVLGLSSIEMILLLLTLGVSTLTFSGNRTNILLGAIHLLLFFAYLMLLFDAPV
ncbi:calcium:proton antiporter [bacterium]|nr:MAG: calcium:proton antiporter [bacterium]